MTLKLWLLLAAFAAFWVVAIYAYRHVSQRLHANLRGLLDVHTITLSTPVTHGPGTFACTHMTVSGVQGASCGICGLLACAA